MDKHVARIAEGEAAKAEQVSEGVERLLDAAGKAVAYQFSMDEAKAREWLARHGVLQFTFEAAPEEFWAEIFAAGTWTDSQGYKDTYTEAHLDQIVAGFEATRGQVNVPLRVGAHDDDIAPAGGWIVALKRVGDKLLGKFADMPRVVREALGKKQFKSVSSGIDFNKEIGGKRFPYLLNHVALLGARLPAVKGLQDLQAYFGDDGSSSHAFAWPFEENKLIPFEEEDTMSAELLKLMQDQLTALSAKQAQFEDGQRKLESDKRELTEAKDRAERELREYKENQSKAAREAALGGIKEFCESKVKAGVMTPAARDAVVGAVAFMDDKPVVAWEQVRELAEKGIVKLDTKEHGRKGDEGDRKGDTADARFTAEVTKAMTADRNLTYSEATARVRAEKPELASEYDDELYGNLKEA